MNPKHPRSFSQMARGKSLFALLAILALLVTPGFVLAQSDEPGAAVPTADALTPAELQRLEEAAQNTDAPVDPYAEGGYPQNLVPVAPAAGVLWLQGFCTGSQNCLTGDFDGNGTDDVVYFVRSTQAGTGYGDVFVALSTGTSFGGPQKWHDFFCLPNDICDVGDFNGDGADDLVSFSRTDPYKVYVTLSTRAGFGPSSIWHNIFCITGEVCQVGDFNGDNRDDIVLFTRSAYGNVPRSGDVDVALSNGVNAFNNAGTWHGFFCVGLEVCQTGDFNGDNRDDIIAFSQGSAAKVWVALSTGGSFVGDPPNVVWNPFFCAGSELCNTGDFDGDGRDDVVTFLRSSYASQNPPTVGDVVVGISRGSAAAGGFATQLWNDFFCVQLEQCDVGDFNGDGRQDIVAFSRGTVGSVWVALSPGPALPPARYVMSMIIKRIVP